MGNFGGSVHLWVRITNNVDRGLALPLGRTEAIAAGGSEPETPLVQSESRPRQFSPFALVSRRLRSPTAEWCGRVQRTCAM